MADAPGLMEPAEEIAYETRCAEGAIWTGTRLLIGVIAMAFAGVGFAYFYLRSVNSEGLWRPHGQTAPLLLGTEIAGAALVGAILQSYGLFRLRRGLDLDWSVATWATAGAGVLGCGLQIWELTRLGFQPGQSGYASLFVAWGPLSAALLLVGAYWSETLAARALRMKSAVAGDGGLSASQLPRARLFRASAEGAAYFWWFITTVSVLFWLLFYIV
ncbi:MAG: hypothetical protein M0Z87_02185 [Actinomycetota bacterium]|nr:hypothetical protein [Actinomycetota bacterium]